MPNTIYFVKGYNNGHSSAAKKFSNIGCPLSKGAVCFLKMQGKSIACTKEYQITERYKKRRAIVWMRAATEWYKRKANERCDHDYCATDKDMHTGGPQHDYCKGQNDPFRPPPWLGLCYVFECSTPIISSLLRYLWYVVCKVAIK
mgnify:CR=1 FL=1